MKKLALLFTLVICCVYTTTAQDDIKQKSRIFLTWIHLNYQSMNMRGVLYEIKDSSILVSNSMFKADYLTGNFKVASIDFKNIDRISIRSKQSVLIGTIVGTVAGFAGAAEIASGIARKEEFAGAMIIFGTPVIALGAGIGALIGSARIHIPINGSFENFKRNESRLKRYSYFHEYPAGFNIYEKAYEHKWFIGLEFGLSIPSGDFKNGTTGTLNGNFAKTGGNGGFVLGYSLEKNFGISVSYLNSSYNVKNSTNNNWWSFTSVLAGPVFSSPLRNSFILDLKPMIGYSIASLNNGDTSEKSGKGFGIYPCALLRYNFSMCWCALAETGYLFSNQKFQDGNKKMQAFNLGAGIAFRFR